MSGISNESIIIDLIKDLGSDMKSQTATLAKLEANQGFQKEKIEEVAQTIKEIKETDLKQSEEISYQKSKIDSIFRSLDSKADKPVGLVNSQGEVIAKYDYKKFVWKQLAAVIAAAGSVVVAVLELFGFTDLL